MQSIILKGSIFENSYKQLAIKYTPAKNWRTPNTLDSKNIYFSILKGNRTQTRGVGLTIPPWKRLFSPNLKKQYPDTLVGRSF
jgi:hypothetical protein